MSPDWRKAEIATALAGNGMVGQQLLSETGAVRVWRIDLAPGERVPYHKHVLDYFWVAMSEGTTLSRFEGGRMVETNNKVGDTRHYSFAKGQHMVHDLENIGSSRMIYTTVELKIGSANAPLPLPRTVTDRRA